MLRGTLADMMLINLIARQTEAEKVEMRRVAKLRARKARYELTRDERNARRRAKRAQMTPEELQAFKAKERHWYHNRTEAKREDRSAQNRESRGRWLAKPGNLEKERERLKELAQAKRKKERELREENSLRGREYRKKHKEKLKAQRVFQKYGLSLEAYNELISQNCEICGRSPSETQIVCDHDHATGAVRGALCAACNTAIGHAREDIDVLLGAIRYLTGRKPQNPSGRENLGGLLTAAN